jgi:hypothetical protein
MHMTMLGESHEGQRDQQGHPNREGGPKLIRFESPRWRTKSSLSPSRALFFMIHIWMERLFDKEANPSGPTSKAIRNQRESSKQVTIQNLSGHCVAVFWAVWDL